MSTVSKAIADEVILHDGMYPGDHQRVVKIVKYQNMFDGSDAYGLLYENHAPDAYAASDYVRNPVLYWKYTVNGFTAVQLEAYEAYETVRQAGDFNMFSHEARLATGLSSADYLFVMKNYALFTKGSE